MAHSALKAPDPVEAAIARWQNFFAEIPWSHGNPLSQWQHVRDTCLTNPNLNSLKPQHQADILNRIARDLAVQVVLDQPWSYAKWNIRDNRPQDEQTAEPDADGDAVNVRIEPNRQFPGHPDEVKHRNLRARPIGNSHRLAEISLSTGHRLTAHLADCLSGRKMAFMIHRSQRETPTATFLLADIKGAWQVQNLQTRDGNQPTGNQVKLAQKTADHHNLTRKGEQELRQNPQLPEDTELHYRRIRRNLFRALMATAILIPLWHLWLQDTIPQPKSPLLALLHHSATHIMAFMGAVALLELICSPYYRHVKGRGLANPDEPAQNPEPTGQAGNLS